MIAALLAPVLALALQASPAAPAPAPALLTIKVGAKTESFDAKALAALPHQTVEVSDHGKTRRFSGVPAAALLRQVGAPSGATLHGATLLNVVTAKGSDGYRVAFSLAELDPGMKDGKVLVADQEDGKPLSAKDGPFKLVVETDKRPARSVRGLVGLDVAPLP
jgi:hypothetical protein